MHVIFVFYTCVYKIAYHQMLKCWYLVALLMLYIVGYTFAKEKEKIEQRRCNHGYRIDLVES